MSRKVRGSIAPADLQLRCLTRHVIASQALSGLVLRLLYDEVAPDLKNSYLVLLSAFHLSPRAWYVSVPSSHIPRPDFKEELPGARLAEALAVCGSSGATEVDLAGGHEGQHVVDGRVASARSSGCHAVTRWRLACCATGLIRADET